MEPTDYIGIGGLLVALVGLITGFVIQWDTRKIRKLEKKTRHIKANYSKP